MAVAMGHLLKYIRSLTTFSDENWEFSNLFKLYSAQERLQYLETRYPKILQRVSLSQLSSFLGVARETLSRIRKRRILL
jgi:hypothetical protein